MKKIYIALDTYDIYKPHYIESQINVYLNPLEIRKSFISIISTSVILLVFVVCE